MAGTALEWSEFRLWLPAIHLLLDRLAQYLQIDCGRDSLRVGQILYDEHHADRHMHVLHDDVAELVGLGLLVHDENETGRADLRITFGRALEVRRAADQLDLRHQRPEP